MQQTASPPTFPNGREAMSALVDPAVLFISLLMAVVFFFVPRSIADPDIWWHLRNAEILVSTHTFIGTDLYSYTAFGATWINHEWLGELPFYFGWVLAGERGVYFIVVLTVELLILGVFVLAYRRCRDHRTALLASTIAVVLSTVTLGPRTVLFGWVFLVLELLLLDLSEDRPSLVWMLPALFIVWVNTHGSWMIGLVLFSVYLIVETPRIRSRNLYSDGLSGLRLRSLLCSLALSVGGLFLNPYGWRLVAYPFNLAFRQTLNIANIEEWRSLDLHSPRGVTLLCCLALIGLSQLCRPRLWRLYEVACLLIGTYAALVHSRFLVLFSILAIPLFARSLGPVRESVVRGKPHSPFIRGASLFLIACLVFGRLKALPNRNTMPVYPERGIKFMREHKVQGRILNEYLWGGYMIWHTRDNPVFIDSRVDIFEYNGTFKDYLDMIRVRNTMFLLDKYEIRYVFFEKDTPLVYLLEHTANWKVDFEDGDVVLLERMTDQQG